MAAPAPAEPPASLTIAVASRLNPQRLWRAPNVAERFVVRHAYEGLVSMECGGRLVPGLAVSWRWDQVARHWVFELRDDIRYWSGGRVGASEIVAAWRDAAAAYGDVALSRLVDAAGVLDERTLIIRLPHDELARLADVAFTVRRPVAGASWPEGTGPFRIRADPARAGMLASTVRLEPARGDSAPRLTVHAAPPDLARDLVDAGVDLVLTDASDLVAYAAARPDLRRVPLGWDRTYVLISAVESRQSDPPPAPEVMVSRREALARNVVGGDARGAREPFWWRGGVECALVTPSQPAPAGTRVVYDRGDPVARALAERVVALSGMPSLRGEAEGLLPPALAATGSRLTAAGLATDELEASLREGREAAWIVALPRGAPTPCLARERLSHAVPWLSLPDDGGLRIVPLVETRWYALLRGDRAGLVTGGDGTPRLFFGRRGP